VPGGRFSVSRGRQCGSGRALLSSVPLPVMPPSFWVASTKPGAALARSQGWTALVRARVGSGAA
jgi:hypothetical protein